MHHGFHKNITQQLFLTMMIIRRNVSWAANQHIRMISERSCDTEDQSYDVEKCITFQNTFKKVILNCNILQYYCFYCSLGEHETETISFFTDPKLILICLFHSSLGVQLQFSQTKQSTVWIDNFMFMIKMFFAVQSW